MPDEDDAILGALATLRGGQALGRYELLTPVGRGGMAIVWAARLSGSHGFSKMVAIKTILPHLAADPRFEQMFLKEARIASKIKHPNVCEILDLGEQSGVLYLVMEWVDGASLATFVGDDAPKLPLEVWVHVVAEAGRGLEAAHALGVVHRDVSPQNILVTADAAVKIVDFGVAKATMEQDQTTQSGFLKGKVAYVAPEQVNGTSADARSDIFALGIMLYELTTGVHPFRGPSDLATLLAIASTDPPAPPSSHVSAYAPALEGIVRKAVAKDPAERYGTMAELCDELEAYLGTLGGASERRAQARASLGAALEEGGKSRARRLAQAEAALERRESAQAVNDRSAGPPSARSARSRPGVIIGASVLALAIGLAAGQLGAGSRPAAAGAAPSSAPSPPPAELPSAPVREPAPAESARTDAVPVAPPAAPAPRSSPRSAARVAPGPAPSAAPSSAAAPASSAFEPRFREPGF